MRIQPEGAAPALGPLLIRIPGMPQWLLQSRARALEPAVVTPVSPKRTCPRVGVCRDWLPRLDLSCKPFAGPLRWLVEQALGLVPAVGCLSGHLRLQSELPLGAGPAVAALAMEAMLFTPPLQRAQPLGMIPSGESCCICLHARFLLIAAARFGGSGHD